MTLGGSLFPGALGSMLIEILPFLRGIASSIQQKLGDDSPSLIPTVMAAYAMTSFLTGFVFIALGALGCGRLLSLSSAGTVLFGIHHLPLLFASVLPAFFLSLSIRSSSLEKLTRGFTQHALYVPVYVLVVAGTFWVIVAATGNAGTAGMAKLAAQGWFFTVEESVRKQHGIGTSWNYWKLYDFHKVEWSAMQSATKDIVLLVVIGVLNLPIYIPALALALDMPSYGMNHELLGHGASNIFAGVVGSIPNLVVFSNSLFFTRAGGGRFEGILVILLTIVLFLVSSLILPYIPTLLASALVLFLGIELMTEAVWESTKALLWCEWSIVIGTLLACTFLGFAPGFGVGIALAMVVHLGWGVFDSRARAFDLAEMQQQYQLQPHHRNPYSRGTHITAGSSTAHPYNSLGFSGNDVETIAGTSTMTKKGMEDNSSVSSSVDVTQDITVVRLSGYAFFATIPSLETNLKPKKKLLKESFILVDLSMVHRLETSVAEFLERKARELSLKEPKTTIVLCGISDRSGIAHDLRRGGANLLWIDRPAAEGEKGVPACKDIKEAIHWCASQAQRTADSRETRVTIISDADNENSEGVVNTLSTPDVLDEFSSQFLEEHLEHVYDNLPLSESSLADRAQAAGIRVRQRAPGDVILRKGEEVTSISFIVRGCVLYENDAPSSDPPILRVSIKDTILTSVSRAQESTKAVVRRILRRKIDESLLPGDTFGFAEVTVGTRVSWSVSDRVVAARSTSCVLLEVDSANADGLAWATRAIALLREKKIREEKMLKAH
ncbi:hypothetical protein IEO21_05135 [Rhodonia placenta]|uniref:STAS domain-containing protein n=1 Tax=Rhodonia placenta TaxID=104341 RepID=A0A8H7U2E3_9APHY|nr:hypothetical protein IEO21_05135 [Postia placenta]